MIQAKLELNKRNSQDFWKIIIAAHYALLLVRVDTISRKGMKKQKHYLNDSLKNPQSSFNLQYEPIIFYTL